MDTHIRRASLQVSLPRDTARARHTSQRVAQLLSRGSPGFEATLGRRFPDPHEVVLVRSLTLRLRVGEQFGDGALATALAGGLADALLEAECVRFADREAHVAAYLEALLAGRLDAWWFRGLRAEAGDVLGTALLALLRATPLRPARLVARLHAGRCLPRLLHALDDGPRDALWQALLAAPTELVSHADPSRDDPMTARTPSVRGSTASVDDAPPASDVTDTSERPVPDAEARDNPREAPAGNTSSVDDDARESADDTDPMWRQLHDSLGELRGVLTDAARAFEGAVSELRDEFARSDDPDAVRDVASLLARFDDAPDADAENDAHDATNGRPGSDAQRGGLRPLYAAAHALLVRLGVLPAGSEPSDARFAEWASEREQVRFDDARALADAVADAAVDAARALVTRLDPERIAERLAAPKTLAGFDWLDTEALRCGLEALVERVRAPEPARSAWLARLDAALAHVISTPDLGLDRARPTGSANALRVLGALCADDPTWATDAFLPVWIPRALATWSESGRLVPGWTRAMPPRRAPPQHRPASTDPLSMGGECTGVFLLARAFGDLRVHPLLHDALPDAAADSVFSLIALACAGEQRGTRDGRLVPVLRAFCPADVAEDVAALRAAWHGVGAQARDTLRVTWSRRVAPHGIADGRLDDPATSADADALLDALRDGLLRAWARWLPGFSGSTPTYLLEHFVHRAGRLETHDDGLHVLLAPGPLDVVLERAGYLAPYDGAHWLAVPHVRFGRPS